MPLFNLRPAMPPDGEQIFRLYEIEKWLSFTREKVEELMLSYCSHYLVAETNNEIIAFARYITDDVMTTFLVEIVVGTGFRRSVRNKMG